MKETVVVAADGFVEIVTSDICELVMFPLIPRLTVAPLDVVADTIFGEGAGVGVGVTVGTVVGVGVTVEVGGAVGTAVGVGEELGLVDGVGEVDGVVDGVGEVLGVVDGDGVGEAVGDGVGEGVGVGAGVGVGVGVGVGASCSVCTVPEIIPDGIAVNWKLTPDVTALTVTDTPDCITVVYSSADAVTVYVPVVVRPVNIV